MPDTVEAAVLGLVQGLTEFLPVSSSGHLVVVPALAGWNEPTLAFDLVLHLGTLLAVLVYFRHDLWRVATGILGRGRAEDRHLAGLLAVGTIPAGLAGVLFEGFFEDLFERPGWVCVFWVVTAAMLLGAEHVHRRVEPRGLDYHAVVAIGAAQAAALAPGISRSGATIAAAMALGLSRSEAARFSFLLSIPAIAGAALVTIPDVRAADLGGAALVGLAVAAVSGYVAIAGLLRLVRTHSFAPFAVYLIVVAPLAALAL